MSASTFGIFIIPNATSSSGPIKIGNRHLPQKSCCSSSFSQKIPRQKKGVKMGRRSVGEAGLFPSLISAAGPVCCSHLIALTIFLPLTTHVLTHGWVPPGRCRKWKPLYYFGSGKNASARAPTNRARKQQRRRRRRRRPFSPLYDERASDRFPAWEFNSRAARTRVMTCI